MLCLCYASLLPCSVAYLAVSMILSTSIPFSPNVDDDDDDDNKVDPTSFQSINGNQLESNSAILHLDSSGVCLVLTKN